MNPRLRTLAKSAAGLGCLFLCFSALERPLAAFELRDLELGWLAVGLLVSVPTYVAQAYRWRATSIRLGLSLAPREALREVYLAALLNLILPSGYAGEAVRVARHGLTLPEQRGLAFRAVVYERAAGQVVFWSLVAAFIPSWYPVLGHRVPGVSGVWIVVGALLLLAGIAAARGVIRLRRVAPFVAELNEALVARAAWRVMLATSLTSIASCLAMYYCALQAVGLTVSPLSFCRLGPLILAAMMVPASVLGFGPREVASTVLLPLLGLDATRGLTASLAYGVLMIVSALPGLGVWFRHDRRASHTI